MTSGSVRPTRRVLLVNNSRDTFTPTISGAIGTCLWELSRSSADQPIEVHVLSLNADAAPYPLANLHLVDRARAIRAPEPLRRAQRRLSPWAHDGQRAFARQVLACARRIAPDVVLINNDPEVAVYVARRLPGCRVHHWFHNLEIPSDRMRRRFARSAVHVFAVSDYLARAVDQAFRFGLGTVRTARNGVDIARFRPAPDELQEQGAPPLVGFLGRVCIEKGTDLFLDAACRLANRGVRLRVAIIGDTNWGFSDGGPYDRRVAQLVEDLDVAGAEVIRTGHVGRDALPAVLARLDLQVVPSRWDEPCALTILEGMASGNALVASATGGTPELVGTAGVLVPRENPDALADAIAALLADDDERTRLGRAAREQAERMPWLGTWHALGLGDPP